MTRSNISEAGQQCFINIRMDSQIGKSKISAVWKYRTHHIQVNTTKDDNPEVRDNSREFSVFERGLI